MTAQTSLRPLLLATTALLLVAPLLAGCAAGPDYVPPASPGVASYTAEGQPSATTEAPGPLGGIQRFLPGGDVPAAWWHLFQSPSLTHTIDTAIAGSPSLEAAKAALRAAEETAAATYGAFFPKIDGSLEDARSKTRTGGPFTVYTASVAVGYAPDIFGGTRRAAESADAKAEAQKFELEAAYLTLTSNVATAAIQEASLRAQIDATKEIIKAQKRQLELTEKQFEVGAAAKVAVLAQKASLASTEASLPPLERQLEATRNRLAVLAGRFPSEGVGTSFDLSGFTLPADLPVSLPSQLVKQRPDIRAAEANLHAANADIGVAMAAMLPQFPLTGSFGVSAGRIADMFSPGTAIWGLAAGLAQPLFQGGELLHKKRASEALFDQAAAQYRATVLSAFQNVADSLKALESDALALRAQTEAERAAFETLTLSADQFNAGAIGLAELLAAQTSYQQAKIGLIQAKANRLTDTVALFQALGGGWWNRKDLTAGQ